MIMSVIFFKIHCDLILVIAKFVHYTGRRLSRNGSRYAVSRTDYPRSFAFLSTSSAVRSDWNLMALQF
jgi:hypothetical protein